MVLIQAIKKLNGRTNAKIDTYLCILHLKKKSVVAYENKIKLSESYSQLLKPPLCQVDLMLSAGRIQIQYIQHSGYLQR